MVMLKVKRSDTMNVRKAGIGLALLFALTVVLSFCYYISYGRAMNQFNDQSQEQNLELISFLQEVTREQCNDTGAIDSRMADTSKEARVNSRTKYVLETYDISTNTTSVEELNVPAKFIGLSRDELIELLSMELKGMPLSEYQKGLVSYSLISFSDEKIVLRKSYNQNLIQYKYYLAIHNNEIIVYYSDKRTIYENTGIDASCLSEHAQTELSVGKYVKDEDELYSLLESYSS